MQYNIYSNKERLQNKVEILPLSEWGEGGKSFLRGLFIVGWKYLTLPIDSRKKF